MKLAEILDGPEKWCQGSMTQGTKVCVMGGLALMLGRDPNDSDILGPNSPVMNEAMRFWGLIDRAEQAKVGSLISWNAARSASAAMTAWSSRTRTT